MFDGKVGYLSIYQVNNCAEIHFHKYLPKSEYFFSTSVYNSLQSGFCIFSIQTESSFPAGKKIGYCAFSFCKSCGLVSKKALSNRLTVIFKAILQKAFPFHNKLKEIYCNKILKLLLIKEILI